MRLPIVTVRVEMEERGIEAEFNTSSYLTTDAVTLRAKANYFISLLRSHLSVLDELVEQQSSKVASSIRAKEALVGTKYEEKT